MTELLPGDKPVVNGADGENVESLLQRLAEAEGTLQAIISGQVDAVAGPDSAAPVLLQHAQDALRRSEERYRDLVARSPAIVCEVAPDGTTLYVNAVVTAILGYTPAELVGQQWWYTLCSDLTLEETNALTAKFSAGEVCDFEMELISRRGERRTIVWNSTTRHAPSGALEAVVTFGLDISERKRAEENAHRLAAEKAAREEAESARHRSSVLAEASRVLGSSLDYEVTLASVAGLVVPTFGDWCAVDMVDDTGALRRIAVRHRDPEKVRWAEDYARRYPPEPDAPRGVLAVMRTGQSEFYPDIAELIIGSTRNDARRDELKDLGLRSAILVPLESRGKTVGAITLVSAESGRRFEESDLRIAEDLAQRVAVAVEHALLYREAEAARAESEHARAEAEDANKAKSQFLASMSHELRTPLNAIAGYVQLLAEGIQGPVNEKQLDYLRRTRRSQQHLLGLINDVLNFAKLEAGRVQFELTDVPLHETLEEVDEMTSPQIGSKGLGYENKACKTEIIVRADRDKLRQIMLNLVSNAIKFTPAGGRIAIECGSLGRLASITVRDTGIGVPTDKVEAIFEPFVQVGKDLSREGTGLGLSISRELARAMQGDLTAQSTLGAGSAFTLTLPQVVARTTEEERHG